MSSIRRGASDLLSSTSLFIFARPDTDCSHVFLMITLTRSSIIRIGTIEPYPTELLSTQPSQQSFLLFQHRVRRASSTSSSSSSNFVDNSTSLVSPSRLEPKPLSSLSLYLILLSCTRTQLPSSSSSSSRPSSLFGLPLLCSVLPSQHLGRPSFSPTLRSSPLPSTERRGVSSAVPQRRSRNVARKVVGRKRSVETEVLRRRSSLGRQSSKA